MSNAYIGGGGGGAKLYRELYRELQDGCQKWQEHDLGKKCQMTVYILRTKNFVEITLILHRFWDIQDFLFQLLRKIEAFS